MNTASFVQKLNQKRLNKDEILTLVELVLDKPELMHPLITTSFEQDALKTSFNASWVLDHTLRNEKTLLLPYLNLYIEGLATVQTESCLRPFAHIVQLTCIAYYKEKHFSFRQVLQKKHLETLTTLCFDWLIGEHKVATKVFAMTSLYYLGLDFLWIHPQLQGILETEIHTGTAGYQSRAKKTLDLLQKQG
ncbi:adenylosuccinate lyase [Flavobacterium sp. ASW18X]|uniref:adenylosuccinate lyase n=1 Tax=Flavobacterium sp. ASW18X TaxID=2572595 RepID=UPI0010AE7762|nr:adenylosuccinate lyase [Flavobacterium sp. ASW18X]TKD60709.1 adenylosuccinate lyase [Flavobacterium sp. ASW18X]